jgi:hypothetical protein
MTQLVRERQASPSHMQVAVDDSYATRLEQHCARSETGPVGRRGDLGP